MSGDRTREERVRRLSGGFSLDGSMSRSQGMGAGDPRHRRGAQAESMANLRFYDGHFRVDEDGKLRLRNEFFDTDKFEIVNDELRLKISQPDTITSSQWEFRRSDTPGSMQTVSYVSGYVMGTNAQFHDWCWTIPDELDVAQAATVTIRWCEHSAAASAESYLVDFDLYEYIPGSTIAGASPISATDTGSIDTAGTGVDGPEAGHTISLAASTISSTAEMLWLRVTLTTAPATTNILVFRVDCTYAPLTTAFPHTHE